MEVKHFRRGFRDVFLPALEQALDSPADFSHTSEIIARHALALIELYRHDWPKSRDPYTLEFTAFMIGAFRALRSGRSDADIGIALERALALGFGWMTEKVRFGLEASADPFAALVADSKEKEANFFGDGFIFARTLDTDRAYHLDVEQCWFVAVCKTEGTMAIAPAFCTFDAIWYEAIDAQRHEARFSRPTTIAGGGSRCRFRIDRT